MSDFNPQDYYNSYLNQAKKEHNLVKSKIDECFNKLKENSTHQYQLEIDIKICCEKELDSFYNKWFFTSIKELKSYPVYFYELGVQTYNLYLDLITYGRKLSQAFYNEGA